MRYTFTHIIFLFLFSISLPLAAQTNSQLDNKEEKPFTVRGSVIESDTYKPIKDVDVMVNGGRYTTTDHFGEFKIQVKKGDQLIIEHESFETIYYTIVNNERIKVKVEPSEEYNFSSLNKKKDEQQFNGLIDSAETYLSSDAKKSIAFIGDALENSTSIKHNGEAYEVLGDIYVYWKQYDLAITNYKISRQNNASSELQLKLARAYYFNENLEDCITVYNNIDKKLLSNWQLVSLYEGLGEAYFLKKDYSEAIKAFNEGLRIAKVHSIKVKVTDLNSKLAEAHDAIGKRKEAEGYFENSLKLAVEENEVRAAEEKVKIADFQNKNRAYKSEIQLRKEALDDIEKIQKDSVIVNESPLTPQKQNYKIGSAYFLQKDYDSAIPFLEKSIEEADKREDLIVKKDATRKLSEVYRDAEDYKKALTTYQEYVSLVDQLYAKKEQEISQATRFRRDINEKQNRITSLESDRALSQSKYALTQERSKNQQLIIYSLLGGFLLLLLTAMFMYKYIRQQRLANNLLALKSLRTQMNPHFIFNALNSVNSFIAVNDERMANKYLSDFSALMRSVLENSDEDLIPLKKELELLEVYTKLEHFRFKDKFDYKITIDKSINIDDFKIPPMLIQPYIENAVWHGLRYKSTKGHLSINVESNTANEIKIIISDDGIGRAKSKTLKTERQKQQNSKGMSNIKRRVAILNEMYKDKIDVEVGDFQEEEDTGTKVIITLKKY